MSDLGCITCAQLQDDGPELALGILPGRERAAAVAHLQQCPDCRAYVRELIPMADSLVDLIPTAEPPLGFETRTLRRLGLTPRPLRRSRGRLVRFAAAAAAALGLGLGLSVGGWALTNASAPAVHSALHTAGLTVQGRHIGQAFAYTGNSPWLYMSVDADRAVADDPTIRCQILRADGSTATIGTFRLDDGYASWGGPFPARSSPVTGVRLLAADGSVLATSTFGPAGR
ncbi:zf-HC2 domain-containing protein [Streptomyces sp. NPDC059373]